ncbi:thiamine phosphate synthase [Anaerotardibacter muris]|uniref:thiamine phosphate synthase n=1 Tax=Anaerotardibacter muris TaxID=2941505 RepID=UPI00203FE33B|nr:thiamine phosphate synthase [Anaerotardibacter muris]
MSEPFQIVAVTNRALCAEPLPVRVARLCEAGIDRVIVREKDLSEHEYAQLIDDILDAVDPEFRRFITVNTFVDIAEVRGITAVQLTYEELIAHPSFIHEFPTVGVSVHSLEEVREAQKLKVQFAIAGHIFATDCKPGLAPRGIDFLAEVCRETHIPIYAIGGVGLDTIAQTKEAGAAGACLMSSMMTCEDPVDYLRELRTRIGER